jgi:energy-coupling factor transporter ATP-binding protein EcfA2
MITKFRVQNFKALRDVSLELTPIHALIGPNDTGKTSVLEAIDALCRSTDHDLPSAFEGSWIGRQLVWNADPNAVVSVRAQSENHESTVEYELSCRFSERERNVAIESELAWCPERTDFQAGGHRQTRVCQIVIHNENVDDQLRRAARAVYDSFAGAHFYRWSPRFLALPVAPGPEPEFRMASSGFGLAQLLDDIMGHDRELFSALERDFCTVFPEFRSIQLARQPAFRSPADDPQQIPRLAPGAGKGIRLRPSRGGEPIAASQASDGTLLVLAYLALLHSPYPPKAILLEEPENGIHPQRLREVMGMLRRLVKEKQQTQVVLTTHSPYLLDLFEPDEVTLCTKAEDGSVVVTCLNDSEAVRKQAEIFTLGEIWTGEGDSALTTGNSKAGGADR